MAHMPPRTPFDVRMNARESFTRWRPYLGYRAAQVYEFAQRYFDEHGIEPSYSQVCEATGIPTRGEVSRIVAGLERRGDAVRGSICGPRSERRMKLLNR